jgi:hypothetical protein
LYNNICRYVVVVWIFCSAICERKKNKEKDNSISRKERPVSGRKENNKQGRRKNKKREKSKVEGLDVNFMSILMMSRLLLLLMVDVISSLTVKNGGCSLLLIGVVASDF